MTCSTLYSGKIGIILSAHNQGYIGLERLVVKEVWGKGKKGGEEEKKGGGR